MILVYRLIDDNRGIEVKTAANRRQQIGQCSLTDDLLFLALVDIGGCSFLWVSIIADIVVDDFTEIFVNHLIFIKKNLVRCRQFLQRFHCFVFPNSKVNRNKFARNNKYTIRAVSAGLLDNVCDSTDCFPAVGDDRIYDAICFSIQLLCLPVNIFRDLRFINECKVKVSGDFFFIVVAKRINAAVKVRCIQNLFDNSAASLRCNRILDFGFNVNPRAFFQLEVVIAALEVDDILVIDQII